MTFLSCRDPSTFLGEEIPVSFFKRTKMTEIFYKGDWSVFMFCFSGKVFQESGNLLSDSGRGISATLCLGVIDSFVLFFSSTTSHPPCCLGKAGQFSL